MDSGSRSPGSFNCIIMAGGQETTGFLPPACNSHNASGPDWLSRPVHRLTSYSAACLLLPVIPPSVKAVLLVLVHLEVCLREKSVKISHKSLADGISDCHTDPISPCTVPNLLN